MVFAVAVAVSLLSGGSALPLKLRYSVVTGAAGLTCVISVIIRRPLPLVLAHRSLHDAERAQHRESLQRPGPAPQADRAVPANRGQPALRAAV